MHVTLPLRVPSSTFHVVPCILTPVPSSLPACLLSILRFLPLTLSASGSLCTRSSCPLSVCALPPLAGILVRPLHALFTRRVSAHHQHLTTVWPSVLSVRLPNLPVLPTLLLVSMPACVPAHRLCSPVYLSVVVYFTGHALPGLSRLPVCLPARVHPCSIRWSHSLCATLSPFPSLASISTRPLSPCFSATHLLVSRPGFTCSLIPPPILLSHPSYLHHVPSLLSCSPVFRPQPSTTSSSTSLPRLAASPPRTMSPRFRPSLLSCPLCSLPVFSVRPPYLLACSFCPTGRLRAVLSRFKIAHGLHRSSR